MTAIAVTIAGSDSGGGAGIQADLKTFSALGVYGASVITALTAQNTEGVRAIHAVPADFVTAEIDAVFSDLAVDAVKIGMLGAPDVIAAVAEGLDRWRQTKVVLDPVMVATSGDLLVPDDAVAAIRDQLIPRAMIVTPNLPEAARLTGEPVAADRAAMEAQAKRLLALGAHAVLVKGGHAGGPESNDFLLDAGRQPVADGAACRHRQHPRHRLHPVIGDRRRSGQGHGPRGRRGRCQDLYQRRHCRVRPAEDRQGQGAGAPLPRLVEGLARRRRPSAQALYLTTFCVCSPRPAMPRWIVSPPLR